MFEIIKKFMLSSKINCPFDESNDHYQGDHFHILELLLCRVLQFLVVVSAIVLPWLNRHGQADVAFMLFLVLSVVTTVLLHTAGLKGEAYNEVYRAAVVIFFLQLFALLRHFGY